MSRFLWFTVYNTNVHVLNKKSLTLAPHLAPRVHKEKLVYTHHTKRRIGR